MSQQIYYNGGMHSTPEYIVTQKVDPSNFDTSNPTTSMHGRTPMILQISSKFWSSIPKLHLEIGHSSNYLNGASNINCIDQECWAISATILVM